MKVLILHLIADNDINGNARRLFLILDLNGDIIEAIDEDCLGPAAYSQKYPYRISLPVIEISVKEYKRYLKRYQTKENK
jgi:hypothetical protein